MLDKLKDSQSQVDFIDSLTDNSLLTLYKSCRNVRDGWYKEEEEVFMTVVKHFNTRGEEYNTIITLERIIEQVIISRWEKGVLANG